MDSLPADGCGPAPRGGSGPRLGAERLRGGSDPEAEESGAAEHPPGPGRPGAPPEPGAGSFLPADSAQHAAGQRAEGGGAATAQRYRRSGHQNLGPVRTCPVLFKGSGPPPWSHMLVTWLPRQPGHRSDQQRSGGSRRAQMTPQNPLLDPPPPLVPLRIPNHPFQHVHPTGIFRVSCPAEQEVFGVPPLADPGSVG